MTPQDLKEIRERVIQQDWDPPHDFVVVITERERDDLLAHIDELEAERDAAVAENRKNREWGNQLKLDLVELTAERDRLREALVPLLADYKDAFEEWAPEVKERTQPLIDNATQALEVDDEGDV